MNHQCSRATSRKKSGVPKHFAPTFKNPSTPKFFKEQKGKIAEIDSKYKAKIAERKIFLEKSVQDALAKGSHEEAEEARRILAQEVNSLEEKAESEKDKIRDN